MKRRRVGPREAVALMLVWSGPFLPSAQASGVEITPATRSPNQFFGASAGLAGDTAVVGAFLDQATVGAATVSSGAAYLFDAQTGTQQHKLTPSDGAAGDLFGRAAAVSASKAIVGAPMDDDRGAASGGAYLFDVATGVQTGKLVASDGVSFDEFGSSVAINNSYALVGAPVGLQTSLGAGSAYVFNPTSGAEVVRLDPLGPEDGQRFGASVALAGGLAVVGSPNANPPDNSRSGSVFVFDIASGSQLREIALPNGETADQLGWQVAADGGVVIAAALGREVEGVESGSAFLFDLATGNQLAELRPHDPVAGQIYGTSVAMRDGRAIVGATGSGNEAAYVFDIATGRQLAKLTPPGSATGARFGISVAIDGETALVGADVKDSAAGSAFLFDVGFDGDFNTDGAVDAADYTLWRDGDASADANGDGAVDFMDYNVWFTTFGDTVPNGPASVPEPTGAALAVFAFVAAARRRGRV